MQVEFSDLIPLLVALISGGVLTGAVRGLYAKFKGRIDREDRLERERNQARALVKTLEEELLLTRWLAVDAGADASKLPPKRDYHSFTEEE